MKNNRRSRAPYPGLNKNLNLNNRREALEIDYEDKLSHEEKVWLSNFNREYVGGDFTHEGENLHKTPELVKSVYDANNARNRDRYGVSKLHNMLSFATDEILRQSTIFNEEAYLELMFDKDPEIKKAIKKKTKKKS